MKMFPPNHKNRGIFWGKFSLTSCKIGGEIAGNVIDSCEIGVIFYSWNGYMIRFYIQREPTGL